jgi:hypothetical protein
MKNNPPIIRASVVSTLPERGMPLAVEGSDVRDELVDTVLELVLVLVEEVLVCAEFELVIITSVSQGQLLR